MDQVTAAVLRGCFVNCSQSQAKKINLPANLDALRWDELDFLGWRDPKAPQRAYLALPLDGRLVGVALKTQDARKGAKGSMCALCLTVHPMADVALFAAQRAGAAGRNGNTVGSYVCANLQCSLYVRGKLKSEAVVTMRETIPLEDKIARLRGNLVHFVHRVLEA